MDYIGLDEVGRGCLAGPLVVCAVRNSKSLKSLSLKDSKSLSKKQIKALALSLVSYNVNWGVGFVSAQDIDQFGLNLALRLAASRALNSLNLDLSQAQILLDGNYNYLAPELKVDLIVRGDQTEPTIMAAAILAKYSRDKHLQLLDKFYPEYGLAKNVGYGTKQHLEAISAYGYSLIHRRTFKIKKLI